MKQAILHFGIFLLTLAFAFQSQAQVTIDQSNFLRGTTYTDTIVQAMPSTLTAPSEGPDQTWDYSALVAGDLDITEHLAVNNHPVFLNATTSYRSDLTFQGFPIQNHNYETVDATGWQIVGQEITDVTFSITAVTGGPNDSLRFVGGDYLYATPNELINFPATYLSKWTNVVTGYTPFELTVAAFGLNKTPGNRKREITSVREIVGYGALTIPTRDGSPSAPMDVLLMKTTSTSVDSVFLGGAPAPPVLLGAFGLTQGSSVSSSAYFFYKPGFGSAVLFHNPANPGEFDYRPQSAQLVSGVRERNLMEVKHYPNPISAGQVLNLETETPVGTGLIKVMDTLGRLAHEAIFENGVNNQIQIGIPANFTEGLYLYQMMDRKGRLVGSGKLLVN